LNNKSTTDNKNKTVINKLTIQKFTTQIINKHIKLASETITKKN